MTHDDVIAFADNIRRSSSIKYGWCVIEDFNSFSWHLYMWHSNYSAPEIESEPHEIRLRLSDIYVCTGVILKHPEPLLIGKHIQDLEFIFHTKCDCGSASVGSNRHSHYCSVAKDSTLTRS